MRIIFDRCVIGKVILSTAKQGRIYVTVTDVDDGSTFEFSSDTINASDVMQAKGKLGSLEGHFESYTFTDQKTGILKTMWKSPDAKFKPEKV